MGLTPPDKVQKLQATLYAKAKEKPDQRFHALYDKVYRVDILAHAYACCRANQGEAGVDGQTFEDIEAYGLETWLGELAKALKDKTYQPEAVRRVWIPKADGGQRPLGIPTVTDRVVQMAAMIVLEPIFEVDLQDEQYAYRAGRNAHDAIKHVHRLISKERQDEVVDADLSGYFDSIPHEQLMKCLRRRIVDGSILHLLKMWLEQPVEEQDDRGHHQRTTANRDAKRGTPQGAPISPLLANIYMRRFVLGWKQLGLAKRFGASIVNYADDFVICCRRGQGRPAMAAMRDMMGKIDLTVNETKTTVCSLSEDAFEFLGYRFGKCYSAKTGRCYYGTKPSRKRVHRLNRRISELTARNRTPLDAEKVVGQLNRTLRGWSNYFSLGPVSQAYRAVDEHARSRLRQWLCRKHKVQGQGYIRYSDQYLHQQLGLIKLQSRTAGFPWAKA